MTTLTNQSLHSPPNVLRSASPPNTLAGIGRPVAAARFRRPRRPYIATASVIIAALAFVLLVWRA